MKGTFYINSKQGEEVVTPCILAQATLIWDNFETEDKWLSTFSNQNQSKYNLVTQWRHG